MKTAQKMTLALKSSQHQIIYPTKTKFFIGALESCDLMLDHDSISEIHAMVLLSPLGIEVTDLNSTNGIFINGLRTLKTNLHEGDTLTIGGLHFSIVEVPEYEVAIHDLKVKVVEKEVEKIVVPQTENENAVLIDDEYCDIIFDEDNFTGLNNSPIYDKIINGKNYIDLDLSDKEYEIVTETDEDSILVSILSSGVIINQHYFSNTEKTIFASGNIKKRNDLYIDLLEPNERVPFITIDNGQIVCQEIAGLALMTKPFVAKDQVVILNYKTYQIMVEVSAAPNKLKSIPFWQREVDFYKQSAKVFAGIMLPMLLLLLVDFHIEKDEEKEVAIIYKKAKPTDSTGQGEIAVMTPNSATENTGHKPEVQNNKVAESQKGANKPAAAQKAPPKPQPKAPQPQKAVAEAPKSPVKAYEFKAKTNINNLFSQTNVAVETSARSAASVNTAGTSQTSPVDTRVSNATGGGVGKLGLDNSGAASASGGTRGLAAKKGLETSYIEPKTVVLGSMDPELLRKILQEYLPQFRHCYQQELAYNADDIQGIVDLNFEISPAGKVSKIDIKTKDSRFSKRGVDCMGKVLSIINFPKPKGGGRVAVRQPLSFFSEKERS